MIEQKNNKKRFCTLSLISFVSGVVSAIILLSGVSCEIIVQYPYSTGLPKLICDIFSSIISHMPLFLTLNMSYVYSISLIFLALLAVIGGFLAIKQIKKNQLLKGKTLAKIGIVIGILVIICLILFVLIALSHRPGPVKLKPLKL